MDRPILDYADAVWRGTETLAPYFSGQLNREGLHELADGVWMWPATGNVYAFATADGLVLFDTGDRTNAQRLHAAVRERSSLPVTTAIYSHGHIDHVLGLGPFEEQALADGAPAVTVVAHEAVTARFDRYRLTAGYNAVVNQRQFRAPGLTWPTVYREPDRTYDDRLTLPAGDLQIELRHGRGETDDATIAWLPQRRILCCGDFYAWNAPNAGNPQKAQRYVAEWAQALRWMASLGADLLLPGHGVPIVGPERIAETLLAAAEVLSTLHAAVLERMNAGMTLDEILHTDVLTPAVSALLTRPYLRPTYDEPEFIVRNLWRQYGGWYDGDPSALKPAPRAELASELAELVGGPEKLAERALVLLQDGRLKLAGHLAELAALSAPDDDAVHEARAQVFAALEEQAPSFMARGIYAWAAAQSRARADGSDPWSAMRGGRWAP